MNFIKSFQEAPKKLDESQISEEDYQEIRVEIIDDIDAISSPRVIDSFSNQVSEFCKEKSE